MLPLSDGIPARRFPIVNISIIVANLAVWIFYELPHVGRAVHDASFYPCTANNSCHGPERGVELDHLDVPARQLDHVLGNMLFLAVFGKNGITSRLSTETKAVGTGSSRARAPGPRLEVRCRACG